MAMLERAGLVRFVRFLQFVRFVRYLRLLRNLRKKVLDLKAELCVRPASLLTSASSGDNS